MTHVKGRLHCSIYPTSQFDYRAMHTYGRLTSSSSRRGHSLSTRMGDKKTTGGPPKLDEQYRSYTNAVGTPQRNPTTTNDG